MTTDNGKVRPYPIASGADGALNQSGMHSALGQSGILPDRVAVQQMSDALPIIRQYAQTEASQARRGKLRVRAHILEVKNGWLIEYEGEQFVFKDEKELAEFFTARRVQNALEGK